MKLRQVVLSAVAAFALGAVATSASAGGSVKDYEKPSSWTGLYLGLHAGAGWADADWKGPAAFYGVSQFSSSPNGAVGGMHVGYQKQWGNLVAGVEVSYDISTLDETVVGPVAVFPADRFDTDIKNLFTAVGRLGYASQNWLVYAKGGYANAGVELSGVSGAPVAGTTFSKSDRLGGWTVGGGVEWKVVRDVSLGLEYNFIDLNSGRFNTTTGGTAPGIPLSISLDDVQVQTISARLSVKIN